MFMHDSLPLLTGLYYLTTINKLFICLETLPIYHSHCFLKERAETTTTIRIRVMENTCKIFQQMPSKQILLMYCIVDLLDHMKILIGNWISQSAFPHDGPIHSSNFETENIKNLKLFFVYMFISSRVRGKIRFIYTKYHANLSPK